MFDLNEYRTIETESRRGAIEPYFTVALEHDMSTHRHGRTALEGTAGAGVVADLLPVPPSGCAVVLIFDHVFYYASAILHPQPNAEPDTSARDPS